MRKTAVELVLIVAVLVSKVLYFSIKGQKNALNWLTLGQGG